MRTVATQIQHYSLNLPSPLPPPPPQNSLPPQMEPSQQKVPPGLPAVMPPLPLPNLPPPPPPPPPLRVPPPPPPLRRLQRLGRFVAGSRVSKRTDTILTQLFLSLVEAVQFETFSGRCRFRVASFYSSDAAHGFAVSSFSETTLLLEADVLEHAQAQVVVFQKIRLPGSCVMNNGMKVELLHSRRWKVCCPKYAN
jgi:hypothetical protein